MSAQSDLRIEQSFTYEDHDWWKWSVWIEGPDERLDAIEDVMYTLHPSFSRPVRSVSNRETKFRLEAQGWGQFRLHANVNFRNGESEELVHDLELYYPDDEGAAEIKSESASPTERRHPSASGSLLKKTTIEAAPRPPAPAQGDIEPIRLFISHRSAEAPAVNDLRSKLEELGHGRLDVRISDDVRARSDGLSAVQEELQRAELLAVLYTARDDEPDWPLYDWAYFRAWHKEDSGRSILLRPPDVTFPSATFDAQICLVSRSELTASLQGLLTGELRPNEPPIFLSTELTPQRLAPLVESAMAAAGRGSGVSINLAARVFVSVDASDLLVLESGTLPNSARVTGDPNALEIIGISDLSKNGLSYAQFRDLLEQLPGDERPTMLWTEHLGRVLATVLRFERGTQAALPMFRSPITRRVYHPVVSTVVKNNDGSVQFVVLFTELPPELDAWPPGPLGAITHILTLTRIFRWGILAPFWQRFQNLSNAAATPSEIQKACRDFDIAINNISADAQNRGLNLVNVRAAMLQGTEDTLVKLMTQWDDIMKRFTEFKQAPSPRASVMLDLLTMMSEINRAYFELFGERYLELLRESLQRDPIPLMA